MTPASALRMMLKGETGDSGRYFPAPKPFSDQYSGQPTETCETTQSERGEAYMESQRDGNGVIDVTEDYEGETRINVDAGQAYAGAGGTRERANFRLAADNITPLIELSKALEEKLRNGGDGHDFLHEVAKVLAAIKRLDEVRYTIELDRLISAENAGKAKKDQKYKKTSIETAVKSAAERETAEMLTKITTVGEVWPDAPEEHHELPLPSGYKYSDDGVEKFISTAQGSIGYEEVSSQPSYMAGWREDITTGEIQAVFRTRTRHRGWIEITDKPSHFGNRLKIADLKDIGCAFKEESLFGKYLNDAYDLIRTRFGLEPQLGTSRLGWHEANDQVFFVFPEQSFGAMPIHLNRNISNHQLQQDLSVKGDIEKEGEALASMMFKYQKLAFAIGTAAASILMRPMKLSGVVDYFGFCSEYVSAQTGTGKSTTVSAAISIYGSPHSVRTFQGTTFGMTQSMILRSDLPTVFQEAQAGNQAGKGNNADPAVILHVLGDGGGKVMGTKGGGLRNNPYIYGTMLLANNENFVNPNMAKQGELQRVFTFEPPFPPNTQSVKAEQEKMMHELSNHHGNGGREMVRKLIEIVDGSWTKLREKVESDYKVQYEASAKAIPADVENRSMFDRRAKIVALVRVGLKYLIEYGYSMPEQITDMLLRGVEEAFSELIDNETDHSDEKIVHAKALKLLSDEMSRDGVRVAGLRGETVTPLTSQPIGGWIGCRKVVADVDCITFNKSWLIEFFALKGLQAGVIFKEWQRQKITVCAVKKRDDKGNPAKYHLTFPVRPDWNPSQSSDHICIRAEVLGITTAPEIPKTPDTNDDI